MKKIRNIAIYLPQFHPIPENDKWWGKGFTEWTNVTKAKPLYPGHYQPHLPKDLGFYDLRINEVREEQANLAREFGIDGFCYYHYWFNGKRILERPVEEILKLKEPNFPFMLCWANENWSRRWDGLDQEILMKQDYSDYDDIEHIKDLIRFFKDPRYICVNGKPVFIIYKPFLLPNPEQTARRWRKVAAEYGLELYLCHMVFGYQDKPVLISGFDAAIDFEPFGIRRRNIFEKLRTEVLSQKFQISFFPKSTFVKSLNHRLLKVGAPSLNKIPYKWMLQNVRPINEIGYKVYPSITPGWDNTARRKSNPTLILDGSSPRLFAEWLQLILNDFKPYSQEENFLFINAWNEWAEGNHLEPCQEFGIQYLQAFKEVTDRFINSSK